MRGDIVKEIQKRLRRWRAETKRRDHLTQEAFAARAGLGKSTIKDMLTTKPADFNPGISTLSSYLAACNKNLGNLFDFLIPSLDDSEAKLLSRAKDHPDTERMYRHLIEMIREAEKIE